MEKALVSAATGALGPVIGKLAELLEKKYMLFKGVRREIKSLKAELEHMHAFLEKLSWVENPDVQVKLCMSEVRELSYDIEDSIDEFMLGVDDGTPSPAMLKGFKGFIRRITNLFTSIRTRCRVAKEVQDLKTLVKEVGERRARYKIDEHISGVRAKDEQHQWDNRVCFLYKDKSELVGTDGPKDELIGLLKQGGQRLSLVSIVGPGGLGKTTLANQVYSTFGEEFKHRAFVSVSRNPNMVKTLRSLHSEVIIQRYTDESEQQCTSKSSYFLRKNDINDPDDGLRIISDFLKDKRFFIVVDDIWDVETWKFIRCAFPKTNCGSRIVITTRINEVAESSCSSYGDHVYKLSPLNVMDSTRLFVQRIFGPEGRCPSHLKDLSNEILTKCAGLPLAIIAISGLLANKVYTVDHWNKVLNSIGHSLDREHASVKAMFSILSLSYYNLPHHLKTCLLYLSIFPEKYEIEKKSLIRRWIAEGFIPEKHGYTKYEFGESCFHELINRSLIQHVKKNIFGEVKTCQVHDMILDFIVTKSLEENFVTFYGVPSLTHGQQKKVRRFSLKRNKQDNGIPSTDLLHQCRSVYVFMDFYKLPKLLEFKILRVLDIEECDLSEQHHCLTSIGLLFQLRYLGLKNTKISEFPEKIKELQHLETLNLKGNKITELPASIVRLGRLIHLLIDGEVRLPDGFQHMLELQELRLFNVFKQSSKFIEELDKLIHMKDLSLSLECTGESDVGRCNEYTKSMVSSICKLGTLNLHSLSISIGKDCDDGFLYESWYPAPSSLRKIAFKKTPISRVPNWMDSSLVNLQQLYLRIEAVNQVDVGILGSLPELLHLVLHVQTQDQQRRWEEREQLGEKLVMTEDDIYKPGLPEFIHRRMRGGGGGVEKVNEKEKEATTISSDGLRLNISPSHEFSHLTYQKQHQEDDGGRSNSDEDIIDDDDDDDDDDGGDNKEEGEEEKEKEGSTSRRTEQEQDATTIAFPNKQPLNFSQSHGFQKLRYLKFDGMDVRKLGLNFESGSMPNLEELVLMFKVAGVFDIIQGRIHLGMEHLTHLTSVVCEIYCPPYPESIGKFIEKVISRTLSTHPNHPRLSVHKKTVHVGAFKLALMSLMVDELMSFMTDEHATILNWKVLAEEMDHRLRASTTV